MATTPLSGAEMLKLQSRNLRGTIAEELLNGQPSFSKGSAALLKFHGAYQQDDRDLRKQRPEKSYSVMVRVSVPGGVLQPQQYLALDRLASRIGDGTLRITSRGGVQYHYVGKKSLRELLRGIGAAELSTFAACGDVVRNVTCAAEPLVSAERKSLQQWVLLLNRELKPKTPAYAEIWLDGEKAASIEPAGVVEPMYGDSYLPRKFKIGFAYAGENTIDVYSNDLGLVAHFDGAELAGFTVLAGGGMGQSNGIEGSFPRLADVVGFVRPEDLLELAKAVVGVHRDFGNRSNRKLARLKYVLEARGVDWFRAEVERRTGKPLGEPRPLVWKRHADFLGLHEQGDGRFFYGMRVISGRIAGAYRDAIREIAGKLNPEIRLTPQQNLIFAGLTQDQGDAVLATLKRYGVRTADELPPILRHSMACPALPTCGLALTESERVLERVVASVEAEFAAAGAAEQLVHLRMTGCPNGCARPYTAEIGIVGQSVGLYSIYLAGSPRADRLARLYTHNVKLEALGETLRPLIRSWAERRNPEEGFGDWCARVGVENLQEVSA
jgi:sulfite reductase (ferredoxin)